MNNINYQIYDTIDKISRADWENVFGDIPEGYNFYKSLEESKLKEFGFFYLALYSGQSIVLIAPLFISDFNLDIGAWPWLKACLTGIRRVYPRFLIMRTLFIGSPFGENGTIGISKGIEDDKALLDKLMSGLESLCRLKHVVLMVYKDFLKDEPKMLRLLSEKGFFSVNSFPSAVNELKFDSFESYLNSLGSATRKNIRRKTKNAHEQGKIEVVETSNIDNNIEDLYALYLRTYNEGTTKFEKLTKDFFVSIQKNIGGNAKFFLYYVNGNLAAFNLCFLHKNLFIDKFIGFDYDIAYKYHLYFVSWCHNVKWCISNGIAFYQTGQTDYEAKVRLGSKLIPLYAYLRHKNRLVNALLRFLALFLSPDNSDKDIKRNHV